MDRYDIEGYDLLTKTVGGGNASSSRINLPLSWKGKRVKVILLDEVSV